MTYTTHRLIVLNDAGVAIGFLDYVTNSAHLDLLTMDERDELFRLTNGLVADKLLINQEEYVELK